MFLCVFVSVFVCFVLEDRVLFSGACFCYVVVSEFKVRFKFVCVACL